MPTTRRTSPAGANVPKSAQRGTRWGAQAPGSESEARDRILVAAERCYERLGVQATTVNDIADEARIHRTTVYTYFDNRDEILTGVLAREMREVIDEALGLLDGPDFPDRLVRSIVQARTAIPQSRFLSLLFDAESAAVTVRVAAASERFRKRTVEGLARFIDAAVQRREVRADVAPEAMAEWVMRIVFMLMTDSPMPPANDEEDLLRTFLLPSLTTTGDQSRARPALVRRRALRRRA
jgi:AcrR family transcriptional regulator